ncbi:hypothetical protein HRR99_03040 [Agrobacterium vaccinii]|uniref:hypothetical protein n=1 Tax=Agrobacterium vaccinii TaxID=2735528 RepID=UPI001E651DA0|nr:hypothetical protein [Agrobacterium vaccinii]UHS60567.1 hypothetical protein HRR99_03040 [Agrobacterium vaccinii]
MVTEKMIEAASRSICAVKGLNPDCLHQINVFDGKESFDTEDDRKRRYVLGWRLQEKFARAALEAALSTDAEPVAYSQPVDAKDLREAIQLLPSVMRPELSKAIIAALNSPSAPAPSVAVKLTDDEKHIGVIRSSVETGAEGKPDSRVSVKEWKDNDDLITVSMFIGNHRWVEGNFTPMDAAKIASLIATKPAVSALSAQVQDVAIPEGWKKIPERYSNYPWSVERYADGWHLNNHDFSATSRFVGVHATAAQAMAAAPAAKQGEEE